MSPAFPSPEFDLAVAAVCHGSATDEQVRALNALLRSHPAARDEYILRVELHSRLASDPDLFASETADPISTSKKVLPLPPARRIPQSSWLLALAACVALLLTGLWWVNRAEPGARRAIPAKRSRC